MLLFHLLIDLDSPSAVPTSFHFDMIFFIKTTVSSRFSADEFLHDAIKKFISLDPGCNFVRDISFSVFDILGQQYLI